MSFAIPVNRLRETPSWMAFHHPQPAYLLHILIVPKRAYASLVAVPADDPTFWKEFIEIVQSLVLELGLQGSGYRLITNGGVYQEIPHLHFHLVAEDAHLIHLETHPK